MRGLGRPGRRLATPPRRVAGLRGMPRGLAVVAERRATARREAGQLRAGRATGGHHCETVTYLVRMVVNSTCSGRLDKVCTK